VRLRLPLWLWLQSRRTRLDRHIEGVVNGDPAATVRELKTKPGKDIWLFGGGGLFHSLLEAGLVDTVEPAIVPVLLGEGIPLLPAPGLRTRLTLTRHRLYPKSGIVLLEYDVIR